MEGMAVINADELPRADIAGGPGQDLCDGGRLNLVGEACLPRRSVATLSDLGLSHEMIIAYSIRFPASPQLALNRRRGAPAPTALR